MCGALPCFVFVVIFIAEQSVVDTYHYWLQVFAKGSKCKLLSLFS